MGVTIRLSDPSIPDDLVIAEGIPSGYYLRNWNLGDAETREVTENAPDADGMIDTTTYVGARAVTAEITVTTIDGTGPLHALLSRLRAYTNPRLRPTLFITDGDAPELQVTLRRGTFDPTGTLEHIRNVAVQWIAPFGVLESAELHTITASAGGTGPELGRLYDLIHPRIYPASPVLGSANAVNAGDADAYPLIRIYGPCTDPVIVNDTAGRTLEFDALTVLSGEFLEVDTRARTIRYNANPADSRYSTLVFPTSRWWSLAPGDNQIRFVPATSSGGSIAEIVYRDTYL